MAMLDRFRSLPAHRHPDPEVRLAHVEALTLDDRDELASIAREDDSPRIRRAAVGKLMDPSVLAAIARDDAEAAVRADAASMLRDIALEAFEGVSEREGLAAVDAMTDPKALSHVAKMATRESVAQQAVARVVEPRLLGSVARHAVLESVRSAAFAALNDHGEIVSVAMNSEFKDTGVAAVERLTDRGDLEQVAAGSNNKSAAKRARGLLRQLDERAASEAIAVAPPPVDPDVEVAAAEYRRLVQQAEHLRTAGNIQVAEEALRELESQWTALEERQPPPPPDLAGHFREAATAVRASVEALRVSVAERVRAEEQREAERTAAANERARAEAERDQKDLERRRIRLQELVEEIEAAVRDDDLRSANRRLILVQREWADLTRKAPAEDAAAARYEAAAAILVARDAEARESDARARRDALKRVQQLLVRVESLPAQAELSAKTVERALRDIRTALSAMPPLPSKADSAEATQRLKVVQTALAPKLQELRAIEDWQRWANVGIQEALCEKMEALQSQENAEETARRIRELQQQWRQAADVPRAQGEALWRRFKAAHDAVWSKCEAHFALEAQTRAENLAKKVALCERAETLADSTSWIQTAEEIKRLQGDWKSIGPVSRGREKAVWERFRAACDRFFKRRHEDLAQRKAMWAENLGKKEALCAKAEELAGSTEWDAVAAEIKRLQAEWKTIGPVKKNRSEAVWQRFRAACDRFFVRHAQRHEIARGENAAAREAICAELEALSAPAPAEGGVEGTDAEADARRSDDAPANLLATVRTLRARWQQELAKRGVDPDRAAALDQRFAAAHNLVVARWPRVFGGTDLDPEANRERMEALVRRVETLASSLAGPAAAVDQTLSPATRLATMLKEALAANTIGGKVDEDSRQRAAQEEVRQAQASWSRIGPVAEPVKRALADRFQRACRKITDKVGVGAPGAGLPARRSSPPPGLPRPTRSGPATGS